MRLLFWVIVIALIATDYNWTASADHANACKASNVLYVRDFTCESISKEAVNDDFSNADGYPRAAAEIKGHACMESVLLSTPELIAKYGYPSESHEIVTEDGYILVFHRIPYGRDSISKKANPKPLYLLHGFSASSDDWVVTGPDHALGYILADAGYDVWIGNTRGNKWGRRHLNLSPNESTFWDTSWHDMGIYDLPAAIDYILAKTEAKKVYYVGHSMGSVLYVVMASEKPAYNEKIALAVLLAPGVFFNGANTLRNIVLQFTPLVGLWKMAQFLGVNEILTPKKEYLEIARLCCEDGKQEQEQCREHAKNLKMNTEYMNKTFLPSVLAHHPSGAAVKGAFQFFQNMKAGAFQQFDYGTIRNLIKYGNEYPPAYDFSRITAPVAIHYADNDGVITPEDVLLFADQLSSLIGVHAIHDEKFNHNDFLYAIKAKELDYDILIQQLNEY